MARLVPSDESVVPAKRVGELVVFRALREDPSTSDWLVLYGLPLPEQRNQLEGEVDFLVMIPGRAIVVIEVKGARHAPRPLPGGRWAFGPPGSDRLKPDPYLQARGQQDAVRKMVLDRGSDLGKRVPFVPMVCWPFLKRADVIETDGERWRTISGDDIQTLGVGQAILRNLETLGKDLERRTQQPKGSHLRQLHEALNSRMPTLGEIETIARLVSPRFALASDKSLELKKLDLILERLSDEQIKARGRILSEEIHVVVTGPAGSGKTILALDVACRHAEAGRRVLYVCASESLAASVREQVGPCSSNLVIRSMLDLLGDYAALETPNGAGSDHWRRTIPKAAILHAGERDRFDELVVDDAQEVFLDDDMEGVVLQLRFLDSILEGGWADGVWRLFGDIYQTHTSWRLRDELLRRLWNAGIRDPELVPWYDLPAELLRHLGPSPFAVERLGGPHTEDRPLAGTLVTAGIVPHVEFVTEALSENFRNPPDLVSSLDRLGDVYGEWKSLGSSRCDEAPEDDGQWEREEDDYAQDAPDFEFRYIDDPKQRVETLTKTISDLLDEGYAPSDLVVLSDARRPDLPSAALVVDHAYTRLLKPVSGEKFDDHVGYCDIPAFLGLESRVVIVTDVMLNAWENPSYLDRGYFQADRRGRGIVERPGEYLQTTFYQALTRATQRAVIILPSLLQLELYELLQEESVEIIDPPFPWWQVTDTGLALLYETAADGSTILLPKDGLPTPVPIVVGPSCRATNLIESFWSKHYLDLKAMRQALQGSQ